MAQQSSQTKTCITCKEVNPPDYKFCGKCGAPLLRPQVQPIDQSPTPTPNRLPLSKSVPPLSIPEPTTPTQPAQAPNVGTTSQAKPSASSQNVDNQQNPQQEKRHLNTIVCPQCGNINNYDADTCLKCGLALAPIREAIVKAGATATTGKPPVPTKPKEPAPSLPQLSPQPSTEKIGDFVASWRFMIRGMGERAEEVAARFFKQLSERGITGLTLGLGQIIIEGDRRDYYFVERQLGGEARTTMAVRIAPNGTDLFVEWRHYVTPPKEFGFGASLWGIGFIIAGVLVFPYLASRPTNSTGNDALERFPI